MKKLILIYLPIFILINTSLLKSEVVNSIVGTVGTIPITLEEFNGRKTFLTLQARGTSMKISDNDVYKDLVEEKVMYLKLKEFDYEVSDKDIDKRMEAIAKQYNMSLDNFKKQIESEGISYDDYQSFMKKQLAIENLFGAVANADEVTDEEALKYYNSLKDRSMFEGDTIIKLSWILFKATTFAEKEEKQVLAQKIRDQAARGSNFAALAKQYSDDNLTKNIGGDIGYQLLADLNNQNTSAHISYALNMVKNGSNAGTISPVQETVGKGFWIVKIEEIQKDQNSIISRVKSYLQEIKMQEAFIKWLDEESKRIAITIYPKIGSK